MSTLVTYFVGLFAGVLVIAGIAPWWLVLPISAVLIFLQLRLFSAAHASDGDQASEELHHPPREAPDPLPAVVPAPPTRAELR